MQITPEIQQHITSLFQEQGKRDKQIKIQRYRHLNEFVKPGQILFVGSSLMEQFPINELSMDLGLDYIIYNRGVGGFTTQELSEVLDVCVYDVKPKHIFINIGTNDLNTPDYTVEGLIGRYERILNEIRQHLPQARLHLMAYYPVNESIGLSSPSTRQTFLQRTNQRIRQANEAVKALAARVGGDFYDFGDGLKDADGNLKREYTVEGLHFYANGYMQVLKQMIPVLKALD